MNKYFNKVLNNFFDKKPAIHFIGIGGIGMSALAGICLSYGYTVTGSDICNNENIQDLIKKGAKINLFHNKKNINKCDIVVFSSAINPDNPELLQAIKLNKCVLERQKFLGIIFNCFDKSIAVAGSHGKTTACGFLSKILLNAKADPQIIIGGNLDFLGGNYRKGEKCCLVEACEYKRNFLSLKPFVPVILNIENDHMDYFKNSVDVLQAYNSFLNNIKKGGTAVINGDDSNSKLLKDIDKLITYGFKENNDCRAINIRRYKSKYNFNLVFKGKNYKIKLNVFGKHNIYNAMAAFCAAYIIGIEPTKIIEGIQKYTGIKRRFEFKGKLKGGTIICDYAHHPSEIKAVLKCAREMFKGTITAVFQPHTYTRTKSLMEDFAKCFNNCDRVILLPVYPAREKFDKSGSSITLYENLKKYNKNAIYLDDFLQAEHYLRQNKSSAIMILGAGDIIKLADMIKE